jgi:hypothetical protein
METFFVISIIVLSVAVLFLAFFNANLRDLVVNLETRFTNFAGDQFKINSEIEPLINTTRSELFKIIDTIQANIELLNTKTYTIAGDNEILRLEYNELNAKIKDGLNAHMLRIQNLETAKDEFIDELQANNRVILTLEKMIQENKPKMKRK